MHVAEVAFVEMIRQACAEFQSEEFLIIVKSCVDCRGWDCITQKDKYCSEKPLEIDVNNCFDHLSIDVSKPNTEYSSRN